MNVFSSKYRKDISHPDRISLLLPTRGRVDKLERALQSIQETTQEKTLVDVWVYVDEDDETMREYIPSFHQRDDEVPVHFHVGERTGKLVDTVNILWQVSKSNAGIYIPAGDDFIFTTSGWDRIVREAFEPYPDRIILGYFTNLSTNPDDMVFPVLSAEWVNELGSVFSGLFPFWFEDYWLDEISRMIQRRQRLEVFMEPLGGKGKTQRMKNVPFWYRYFTNTMEERMQIASRLRRLIYPEGSPEYRANETRGKELAQQFWEINKSYDDARCHGWEVNLAAPPKSYSPESVAQYVTVECDAVNLLMHKLDGFIKEENDFRTLETLDNLLYASQTMCDVQYLRAHYLMKARRMAEALAAIREEILLQPNDEKTMILRQEIEAQTEGMDAQALVRPGIALMEKGDQESAYKQFLTITYQYPHYLPGFLMLGQSLMNMVRLAESGAAYQKALLLDTQNVEAHLGLGKVYYLGGRFGEAQAYLRNVVELDRTNKEAWVGLAMVEEKIRAGGG